VNYGGIYDGTTGQEVTGITDFKFSTSATVQQQRAYLYYDSTSGDNQYFWDPSVVEVNGSEPSIESLLGFGKGSTQGTNTYFGGSVGIGTASPGYKLDVQGGQINASGGYCINGSNCITSWPSGGGGGVTSVFGRSGAVVAASGDYSVGQITGAAPLASPTFTGTVNAPTFVGNLNASNVTSGQFASGNYSFPASVGIGTTSYGYTLTVNGTGDFTGKLTVSTIDPVYAIGGVNYATYVPAMTGEKEESAGLLTLACAKGGGAPGVCSTTIDFNKLTQGSDVWLFGKATNMPNNLGDLIVMLTPSFDGKVWYKKDVAAGVLTVYGDQAGEVSSRFTAPRFDAAQWPNTAPAGETPNFTVQ
jgi:hypothetical protein